MPIHFYVFCPNKKRMLPLDSSGLAFIGIISSGFASFQRILCKGVAPFDRTVMKLNTKNRGVSGGGRCYCCSYPYLWVVSQTLFHRNINPPLLPSALRTDFHSKNSRDTFLPNILQHQEIHIPACSCNPMLASVPRSKHRQLQPKKLGEFLYMFDISRASSEDPQLYSSRSNFSVTATRPKRAITHG